MKGDSLEAIEPFISEIMQAVAPGARKRLALKLMQMVRRANNRRILANRTPEGAAMAPRKKREGEKRGKMFKRIGNARSMRIRATSEMGELSFANGLVASTAATHHYGLKGFVGKTSSGRTIRTKYQARELLGFGEEREQLLDEVLRHLEGG